MASQKSSGTSGWFIVAAHHAITSRVLKHARSRGHCGDPFMHGGSMAKGMLPGKDDSRVLSRARVIPWLDQGTAELPMLAKRCHAPWV